MRQRAEAFAWTIVQQPIVAVERAPRAPVQPERKVLGHLDLGAREPDADSDGEVLEQLDGELPVLGNFGLKP